MSYYKFGERLYLNGDYSKAYETFERGYVLGIDANDCLNYMGCCQIDLGNYELALDIFDKLISSTEWERPYFNKGRIYLKLGDFDKAKSYFAKAVKINPKSPDAYYYLGTFFEKKKDYRMAIKYYKKSLSLDQGQPEAHLNLGFAYLRLGEIEKAIYELEISKKDDFTYSASLNNLGVAFYKKKEYKVALEYFLKVLPLLPNDIGILNDIANCHYHLRKFTDCLDWLDKVIDIRRR